MDQVFFFSKILKYLESIDVEELEQPLISLGLCKSREEVWKLMQKVDDDGSGEIEFDEFLSIIKNASENKNKSN